MAKDQEIRTDAIILGAGPVGLFAVFELGLLGLSAAVVDILDKPGGQCAELYPEKPIYDIPAIPICTGQELTDNLLAQIKPFDPHFVLGEIATDLTKLTDGNWQITTDYGTKLTAPVVIIAAGGGSFVPKKPPLPNLAEFENHSLFYAVRDRQSLQGRNILIMGGGDSALDWAMALQKDATQIKLLHRRTEFRAMPDTVAKVKAAIATQKIDFYVGQVAELHGEDGQVSHVDIKTKTGEITQIPCDTILAFYGLTMKLGPVANFGLEMENNLIPVETTAYETNLPAVFAIGDIVTYPGKLKLILSGFHEAALMAQKAFTYARPGERLRFQYTTSSSDLQKKLGVAP